ncbi:MAG: B12-binding domain-containing radical SAM protein [Blastocatellia bacterium]
MKALLVYPEFPDTYWSFRHALPFYGKKSAFPPLGLLTVAAMLPREWERRLVDLNVRPLEDAEIAWADMVFLSAMLVQKDSLHEVVRRCQALGKRVVLGGPYVTTSAGEVPLADHIFIGEAETTLPEFIDDLARGAAKRVYQPPERPALSLTPPPEFQLIDAGAYYAMSVQFSRGCPFQCEFCDIIEIYGRKPRTKSNAQMLTELDALERLGWRGLVFIVDDNFIGNKPNVKKLLPELAAWSERRQYPFSFITEASVNLAEDEELLAGMQRAGFSHVFLGIETPVEETLKEAQKNQNTRRNLLDSVRKIQDYGMEVMAGFIVGFDNDPADIFERQIRFIEDSAIPMAMVGILTALPETQLSRRLQREGRLLTESTGNNTDGTLNFIPRMDAGRLLAGYRQIMRTLYDPRNYYRRALSSLARTGLKTPVPLHRDFLHDALAFARLLLTLGLRDAARREFWRYFYRALLDHPQHFATAMRLAAIGYHLRKLTESEAPRLPASGRTSLSTARELPAAS